jgi:hypothetical protein
MTQGVGTPPFTQGFISTFELDDHFSRHAAELGLSTKAAYLAQADRFLGGPIGPNTQQCRRPRGRYTNDKVRWNSVTGEFGIQRADGFIRTYYWLDLRGYRHRFPTDQDYFQEQCRKT